MRQRNIWILVLGMLAVCGWLGLRSSSAPLALAAPQGASPQTPSEAPGVIRAEANLVLVDVVVTDKKGDYITDLEAKDFHVYDDNAEQTIASFSRGNTSPNAAPDQKRYVVLFFDNSTISTADQMRARKAATEFVEKTASPDRLMAVVDFTGLTHIAQNFTADAGRLKQALSGIKYSAVASNQPGQTAQIAAMGAPSLGLVGSDFGARSLLLSMRELAKNLRSVTGRKSLVLFSGGFPLTAERDAELKATIDALNKANVAVYPVDVRGLLPETTPGFDINQPQPTAPGFPPAAEFRDPSFPHQGALLASLVALVDPDPQRPAGGSSSGPGGTGGSAGGGARPGGGGTATGGGTTGGGARPGGANPSAGGTAGSTGRGGTTGRGGGNPGNTGRGGNNPYNQPNNPSMMNRQCGGPYDYLNPNCPQHQIIPTMPETASTNQQVLYALAAGTGGFTIFNTNDFLAGLNKIAKELDEYYVLGYAPTNPEHDGRFHEIRVKVDRHGAQVRSRSGYYDLKGPDMLRGKEEGKILESRAASPQPGDVPMAVSAPYFYTAPDVAHVNIALQVPASALDFQKEKGKFHSQVNVLGIAYHTDGSVAARFSDAVKLDYEKKELKDFSKGGFTYQNGFDIAPGKYKLKLVLGVGGDKFAKIETPLTVDPFNGQHLQLSGPALSDQVRPISQLVASLDTALLEERPPLTAKGLEVIPSPNDQFSAKSEIVIYAEIYEPLMRTPYPPRVGVLMTILNRKTNQPVFSSNTIPLDSYITESTPLIPIILKMPMDKLSKGDFRLQLVARDSAGGVTPTRSADFTIE